MPTRRRRITREVLVFAGVFLLVHAVIAWGCLVGPNQPIGDVQFTYERWVTAGAHGSWVGIDEPFVYPVLALVPMIVAAGIGLPIDVGWLLVMTVLDAVVVVFLWRYRAFGYRVVWGWLLFLLALGPIGLARIDTVATALALVGVAVVTARPAIASALFALGAWVKVWPAALVAVLLLVRNHRRGAVIAGAATVTGVVVLVDLVLGGGAVLLSFVGQQTGRGLQVEAPIATPFMWAAAAGVPGATVYYDQDILTFQVSGPGTEAAASVANWLMVVVVLAGVALAVNAIRRGVARAEIAPVLALLLVAALIATNKVGSPQYVGWFAVPVVWGLIAGRASARRFVVPAVLALVAAGITQAIYPWWYDRVLGLDRVMLVELSVRNALEVALLVWAMVVLVVMERRTRTDGRSTVLEYPTLPSPYGRPTSGGRASSDDQASGGSMGA